MKVMISLPMNGRKDDEVKERIKELKEKFAKYHIDVIDSFLTDKIENSYHPRVYYLGRTLTQFMHNVDAVYFDDGWEKARGCRIERNICNEYDIKILDESFFKQETDKIQIAQYKNENEKHKVFKLDTDSFAEDIYNHIPIIDGLEDQDEDNI